MRFHSALTAALIIAAGCAPYRQLKPKPELSPAEQGYLELRNDKKDFELKKDKKYSIAFPAPQQDNFYLVLTIPDRKKIDCSFTSELIDGKRPGTRIKDETPYPDSVCVFPISRTTAQSYWLIEKVPEDILLRLRYRYAPQWRYRFETSHARFQETLASHRVERETYESIGAGMQFDKYPFTVVLDSVARHTGALDALAKELAAIESIFPATILNSSDEAYQNYLSIKKEVGDEIAFQRAYHSVLSFLHAEFLCRGNTAGLLDAMDAFTAFFATAATQPDRIRAESRLIMQRRLEELVPWYDQLLGSKQDAKALDETAFKLGRLTQARSLHENSLVPASAQLNALYAFIDDFQMRTARLKVLRDSLDNLAQTVQKAPGMPDDNLFRTIAARCAQLPSTIPPPLGQQHGRYAAFACAAALNETLARATQSVSDQLTQYRQAEAVVPQLNQLKTVQDYPAMLAILKQYLPLTFLIDKYKELDRLSLESQGQRIREQLAAGAWGGAESGLVRLHGDENFLNPSASLPLKESLVRHLEDTLYIKVENVTRSKVNAFLDEKVNTLENVDSLYTDSVFLPAWDITFSSGSKRELVERKNQLVADLARMKENEFPTKAIRILYEQFLKNPDDNGVLKARAVVTHGKYYKGDNRDVKIRVAECDPHSAKWITKPKEYRRVFALPVTSNTKGKNRYVFRLNVNIPTEAQFPVYDVNIKLPREIAQNAASEQWYDEITLNKKLLKNEGRFTISAPSAASDWECQITPVQMTKDKGNILEVSFTYNAFKVFPVSVMVQKPIIKKN